MLAHDPDGVPASLLGQLQVAITVHAEQADPFHPADGLAHRRPALVETLRDPGAKRHDALFLQLEDRTEIHLRRVDEPVSGQDPSSPYPSMVRR